MNTRVLLLDCVSPFSKDFFRFGCALPEMSGTDSDAAVKICIALFGDYRTGIEPRRVVVVGRRFVSSLDSIHLRRTKSNFHM